MAPLRDRDRERVLVPVGGASIDVVVEGVGPAIVLLPSSLRDSLDFDPLAERLAAGGHRVLRPQPRGMGRSSPPPPDMTLATLAADVAGVIGALGDGPAVVVGHAYGHWVARVTDHLYPDRVAGVVVLAAAAQVFPNGVAEQLAIASDTNRPNAERLTALQACMFAPGNDASVWLTGWYPQWRTAYRQASQSPARALWYGHTHAPLLDLQGAEDVWRPPPTKGELTGLLGSKAVARLVPRAGHAMVPEQPEAVAGEVLAWVRERVWPGLGVAAGAV
jgi:pimeloyl-ACP methyl ester carboxylesterase